MDQTRNVSLPQGCPTSQSICKSKMGNNSHNLSMYPKWNLTCFNSLPVYNLGEDMNPLSTQLPGNHNLLPADNNEVHNEVQWLTVVGIEG